MADIGISAFRLTDDQVTAYHRDGFVIIENIIDPALAGLALSRYELMFSGTFETGLYPDEWNWKPGRDDPALTRQICNGWKSDRAIARVVLREDIGQACARLGGWNGARIAQDNLFWKPPGGRPLGFHQDAAYDRWALPVDWVSCWVALDDTTAAGGTLEFVRGSHRWDPWGMIAEFHGPEIHRVPVEVPAGGGAFHSGRTWHGSGINYSPVPRRSLVSHCTTSDARYNPDYVGYIYSRYKRFGNDEMDESFFPIIWRQDGYRSGFLGGYLGEKIGWGGN
jgi:ectoine hydroxylase-related dioxygenase (phytanoyl-CoA dioxygenase family)